MSSNRSEPVKKRPTEATGLAAFDRPVPAGVNAAGFGSDVVADALRATDIPYIALNPGASYRGLHDSLVNYLGNERPQMLLCLHEESAVAIAHGYAKVTGTAMAAAVHSNVGLMHATMATLTAPAAADDLVKMTIGQRGNWDTSITHLGEKAGIFKKHGLQLEMIYTSGSGETLQPVISGSVDLGLAVGTLGAMECSDLEPCEAPVISESALQRKTAAGGPPFR